MIYITFFFGIIFIIFSIIFYHFKPVSLLAGKPISEKNKSKVAKICSTVFFVIGLLQILLSFTFMCNFISVELFLILLVSSVILPCILLALLLNYIDK